jgi:hypothetical protein
MNPREPNSPSVEGVDVPITLANQQNSRRSNWQIAACAEGMSIQCHSSCLLSCSSCYSAVAGTTVIAGAIMAEGD